MTLLPVSIELVDQSNPSNCADSRLLTQQEFAHLLELANYAVRSEVLDAQDREQAKYMKNNVTWVWRSLLLATLQCSGLVRALRNNAEAGSWRVLGSRPQSSE